MAFPEGFGSIGALVVVEARIVGFLDHEQGIDAEPERVVDVDYLPPVF